MNKEEFLMKRKFVSVILTAAVVAGTLSAATVVSADSGEGKVINIYSWKFRLKTSELILTKILQISMILQKQQHLTLMEYREVLHGSAARELWYIVVTSQKMYLEQMIRKQ